MILQLSMLALTALQPNGASLNNETRCYTIYDKRSGSAKAVGVTWQTVRQGSLNGRKTWTVVVHQRAAGGKFDMRDTFVLDAADLQPLTFVNQRQGKTHVSLTYQDGHVRGTRVNKEGIAEPIDVSYQGPLWEGNLYGLMFSALPLAAGGAYHIPYYQYDKGLGEFTVNVKGTEKVAGAEVWVVDAGASQQHRSEYLLGRDAPGEIGYRNAGSSQELGGDCSALETASQAE